MKIAVFGASGRTGSLVVEEVLKRGHRAVAVTRTALKLPTNNLLENRVGDVTSASFDSKAIEGCDKIISCIGQRRRSPLSKSSSPNDILSSVMRAVVGAIGSGSSRQVVYLSAFGVGEDLKKHSIIFRAVLKLFSIGDAYKDHAEAEILLKSSGVSWTIVRPVGLVEKGNGQPAVDLGNQWSSFDTVSFEAVAQLLVDCVEDPGTVGKTMTIGKRS